MKKIVFGFLMALVTVAFAQTPMVTGVSYTDPTEYTDDSPLAPQDITGRTLVCGTSSGNYTLTLDAPAGGQIPKEFIMQGFNLAFNTEYFCAMTVTAANGLTSAYSAEVNFIVEDQRVPRPPVLQLY